MFREITYFLIFGKPLIMYLGIITLTSFLVTALIGYLIHHGNQTISFKWHPRMAVFSITLAVVHGLLGILTYF